MFDNPKKELLRLEQELLKEMDEEDCSLDTEEFEEDEEDFDPDCFPRHNVAMDFSRTVYDDEEFDESKAVVIPAGRKKVKKATRKQKKLQRKQAKKEKKLRKKRRGTGSQILLAIIELAVVFLLIRWCMQ